MSAGEARRFHSPHHPAPVTHLLSNGSYGAMITAAGSGYSRCRDLALTRWREDPTCDPFGHYVYLRDAGSALLWSAAHQPVGREPDRYEVAFYEDRAEFLRVDGPFTTHTEILVSPFDDVEVRRVTVRNRGSEPSEIDVTSYAELALANRGADDAHPAFSKMFVQTEFIAGPAVLLAHRRPRDPAEPAPWLFHVSTVEGETVGALQYETDRARFLGRGRDARTAASIQGDRPLSGTSGTVLDPVIALRRRLRIAPAGSARITFWSGVADSRAAALTLAARHGDAAAFDAIKSHAAERAAARLRDLRMDPEEARQCQRLASALLYADPSLRAPRETLGGNTQGPQALWPLGISGDLPIVLLRIPQQSDLRAARQMLRAQAYWHLNGLAVDLVVLLDASPSAPAAPDAPATPPALEPLIAAGRGKVFILRADAVPTASLEALMAAARLILPVRSGPAPGSVPAPVSAHAPAAAPARAAAADVMHPEDERPALEFHNGIGGFAAGGREYHVVLQPGCWTPAPWINVIANAGFATLVSADGAGCSGSLNAHENQITPWSNDPVSNPPSEVVYLKDEHSGELWSATPLPIRDPKATYLVRHGFGYTRFQHNAHGLDHELLHFVPLDDPLKMTRLRIVNRSAGTRQLSVTYYLEWVLGSQRARAAPFIVTELDGQTRALLARNPWNSGFETRIAFMDMGGLQQSATGDRGEFLGRHGSLAEPAALRAGVPLAGAPLSNRAGGGWDPCGVLQTRLELRPGESAEIVMILGEAESREAALALIRRYRNVDVEASLADVAGFWDRTLGSLTVATPDRAADLMLNGWLLYQTLACRLWARAAFYQTSGAYGFRDQLQDVMALAVSRPELVREHLLRAAARQFTAGDVQHWWLPGSGLGVRTRMSDDRIWLAFVTAHYLEVTRDESVLDEIVPFLEEKPLTEGQLEIFSAPRIAAQSGSLFEHCARALDVSLAVGAHGLPLIGTGDWNDGMNRVGVDGRGESVWLGWFLHAALVQLAPLAERRGETQRAARWREHARNVAAAIERNGWDGGWYLRGYYDDGTALGSSGSEECRIDSIAQSWAVLSGAGDAARARQAMQAVDTWLIDRDARLVKLFTPPFDRTALDPGYVKAYPPGLRENGGQYTHAATWSVLAFALMGDGDRAGELFALLNPVGHAKTPEDVQRYQVEPYVVCADVYSVAPHTGRGGWTWYTGSAGWLYRAGIEGILGIHRRASTLRIEPCIPRAWPGFDAVLVHGSARYLIRVDNPRGVCRGIVRATLDGRDLGCQPCEVGLVDDAAAHRVHITLG